MSQIINKDLNTYIREKNTYHKNFKIEGMDLVPNNLSVDITSGECDINGSHYLIPSDQPLNQVLEPRMSSLIYAQEQQYSPIPKIGKVNAQYPDGFIDNNTIGYWKFNKTGNIPNSAVGISSIAVMNDLIPSSSGLTLVDGLCDYAIQSDGVTGDYSSSNSTGIPINGAEMEINILMTHTKNVGDGCLCSYGGGGSAQELLLYLANGIPQINYGSTNSYNVSSNYTLDLNSTNLITFQFSNGVQKILINGHLLLVDFKYPNTLTASNFYLFRRSTSSSTNRLSYSLHFLEIRNKCRSPQQIAQIANQLLFPVRYDKYNSSYPSIPKSTSGWHEWRFDDTGTILTDSNTDLPINGTISGTTVVDCPTGLGKGRYFNGVTTDKITVGKINYTSNMCVVALLNKSAIGGNGRLFGSVGTDGYLFELTNGNASPYMECHDDNTSVVSDIIIPANTMSFVCWNLKGTSIEMSLNCNQFYSSSWSSSDKLAINSSMGVVWDTNCLLKGEIYYLAVFPKSLTRAEIKTIYKSLMDKQKSDIRELLPENSISLGKVSTTSTVVKNYNSEYWKYGVRYLDNRNRDNVFLGKRYFSGATPIVFDSPFGVSNIYKRFYASKLDSPDYKYVCNERFNDSHDQSFGVDPNRNISYNNDSISKIYGYACAGGVVAIDGSWITSGYIYGYATCLDID